MAQLIKSNPQATIQLLLDNAFGKEKVRASSKNTLVYLFPEIHHGCNEMEAGTWKFDAKGTSIYLKITYKEAFGYLKAGTKPVDLNVISAQFNKVFGNTGG